METYKVLLTHSWFSVLFVCLLFSEELVSVQTLQLFGYILKFLNKNEMFSIRKRDLKFSIRNHIYTDVNNTNNEVRSLSLLMWGDWQEKLSSTDCLKWGIGAHR